ncbi:unnamed protein product [Strongylus vulgaris]|uniref:Serpentine receptor class gamma n=1 Tax=Strongylus vulgaris TaxID=40348 RepID=A0A3P7ILW5_STRVU|nr:unnamed protein product [Strongylus vulgaris]
MGAFTGTHFFTHLFGCLLMTINRYTAACHPNTYSLLWKPKIVNLMLIIEIFISFVVHTPLFLVNFEYQWIDNKWVRTGRSRPIPYARVQSNVVVIVYEMASVTLIILTVIGIAKLKKQLLWREMVSFVCWGC